MPFVINSRYQRRKSCLEGKFWFHSLYFKSILFGVFGWVYVYWLLFVSFFFFFLECLIMWTLKVAGKETCLYFHFFSFFFFFSFDTVSLITELLLREVAFHTVATEVKKYICPKTCTFCPQICPFFFQSVLMWHCQFHYSGLLLPCKLRLDFHYI